MMRIISLTILAFLGLPCVAAASPAPITGQWFTEFDRAVVRIVACGGSMCGTLIGPGPGTPKGAPPPLDRYNQNPALRARSVIGLTLLSDAKPDGDQWRGTIYSPDDGRAFAATFKAESTGTLRVKGCWGIICRTQHWKPTR